MRFFCLLLQMSDRVFLGPDSFTSPSNKGWLCARTLFLLKLIIKSNNTDIKLKRAILHLNGPVFFFQKEKKQSTLNFESVLPTRPGVTTFVTTGLPIVRVPVLSNTIVSTVENFSKILPPRQSIPLVAPNDVPTWKTFHVRQNVKSHISSTKSPIK